MAARESITSISWSQKAQSKIKNCLNVLVGNFKFVLVWSKVRLD
jgi:hypothetical protein